MKFYCIYDPITNRYYSRKYNWTIADSGAIYTTDSLDTIKQVFKSVCRTLAESNLPNSVYKIHPTRLDLTYIRFGTHDIGHPIAQKVGAQRLKILVVDFTAEDEVSKGIISSRHKNVNFSFTDVDKPYKTPDKANYLISNLGKNNSSWYTPNDTVNTYGKFKGKDYVLSLGIGTATWANSNWRNTATHLKVPYAFYKAFTSCTSVSQLYKLETDKLMNLEDWSDWKL